MEETRNQNYGGRKMKKMKQLKKNWMVLYLLFLMILAQFLVSNVSWACSITDKKTPEQLSIHVGENPAKDVNITYTTQKNELTEIIINKKGDNKMIYKKGISYLGHCGKYIHQIFVTGLEPNTNYEYSVGYKVNTYSGSFKTALEKGSNESFRFSYIADTQVSNGCNAKALGATLAEINKMNYDFIYLAGDVTDTATDENQWEWLFKNNGLYPTGGQDLFANTLLAVTQGNHDNNNMYQHITVPSIAGKMVYSFDYGSAKFIILNLEEARFNKFSRMIQTAYLSKVVRDAKANNQWVIVGFHKSIYSGASHIVDCDIIEARTYWSPILTKLDVDMVLQGHDHVYSRGFVTRKGENAHPTISKSGIVTKSENAPLYVTGGHAGGLKWYDKKNYSVSKNDPLAKNYSFLDVNSTDTHSKEKEEQVFVEFLINPDYFTMNTYMLKYDVKSDRIATNKYLYDSLTVKKP
jgi:hypothetical protein